jgi:hypothetical protein
VTQLAPPISFREEPARSSLPEFQTTGRSRENDEQDEDDRLRGARHEQGMTKPATSVYWAGVSPDTKGTNLYNPILVRYFRRSDREALSRRRYARSGTLRKQ